MAVVSYVSDQDAAEKIKPVFEGMEKKLGVVPNVFRVMAHNPEMLEAFLGLNATLPKTKLNGKLRELAYIKTSELNGCDYCLHHHRTLGKKAGLNDRQVAETAQGETSDAYDELEREVMRYAEEVTRHINVSDELLGPLEEEAERSRTCRAGDDGRHCEFHEPGNRDPADGAALSGRCNRSGAFLGSAETARAPSGGCHGREGQDDPRVLSDDRRRDRGGLQSEVKPRSGYELRSG